MNDPTSVIIELGANLDEAGFQASVVPRIQRSYFERLAGDFRSGFSFLDELGFEQAFHYIRGLVACEEAGISPYRGSVSLVIRAFAVVHRRPVDQWAVVADWVVANHGNPWSPFNFKRTRDQWEEVRRESSNPVEIARRAAQLEREYEAGKRATHERQLAREYICKMKKQVPPESEFIRQRIIEELERDAGWPELRD